MRNLFTHLKWAVPLLASASLFILCTEDNPVAGTGTQVPNAKLTGMVIQNESFAKVYLLQGRIIDSATVDTSDGYFQFPELISGTYEMKVVAQGFDTFATTIHIKEDMDSHFIGYVFLIPLTENYTDTIPSIYDYHPQDQSEIIYLPPDQYSSGTNPLQISVSFDRPMDRESVEKALSIEPSFTGGYFLWYTKTRKFNFEANSFGEDNSKADEIVGPTAIGGTDNGAAATPSADISTYSTVRSFTLRFPRSACITDTVYRIKISQDAVDTSGTPLDTVLEFSFRTIQSAVSYKGIQMTPHHGEDYVALKASSGIKLVFPRRMDEKSVEKHLSVTPDTTFFLLWEDYNHATIFTGGCFAPDTTYVITVDSAAQDIEGKPLGKTTQLYFKTQTIRIASSTPSRGQLGVSPGSDITLTFNTYMDRTAFSGLVGVTNSKGVAVAGTLGYGRRKVYENGVQRWVDILDQIVFDPTVSLDNNEMYTLTLQAGAKDLKGYAMRNTFDLKFVTQP